MYIQDTAVTLFEHAHISLKFLYGLTSKRHASSNEETCRHVLRTVARALHGEHHLGFGALCRQEIRLGGIRPNSVTCRIPVPESDGAIPQVDNVPLRLPRPSAQDMDLNAHSTSQRIFVPVRPPSHPPISIADHLPTLAIVPETAHPLTRML